MYPLSYLIVAATALASFATATPPSCFLAAIMEQPNPADTKAICGALEPQMAGNLTSNCASDAFSAAVAIYSSTCKATANIDITISSASPSSTQTRSSSPSSTGAATSATTGSNGATVGTSTGTAATTSITGKNSASRSMNHTTCFCMLGLLSFSVALQYLCRQTAWRN